MNFIQKNGKGILLAIAIMLIAKGLSVFISTLGTALIALLIGIIVRQFIRNFTSLHAGVTWSEKYLLEAAIVLIGFGFQLSQISSIGYGTAGFVMLSVFLVLGFALVLQKFFGYKGN